MPVADKPDSQEICFIPDGDYRRFVAERAAPRPGEMVDTNGRVVGAHPGVQFFTVGQRRGLGLPGGSGRPLYVVSIDAQRNRVAIGREEDLFRTILWASSVNYVSGLIPKGPIEVNAKIRYKASEAPALLVPGDGWAELRFHKPQRAVTPGQAVVFYRGDEVLGGGIIEIQRPAAG